jgi:hypothetical protein
MNWLTRILAQRPISAGPVQRPATRLKLEELEQRLTPSSTSTNWSGYAITATAGTVTSVSGEFNVPTVTGSGATSYSATWVGIDGDGSSSVEQTGIEADVVHGVAQYSAWYEMYPQPSVTITSLAIHPGDEISASVVYKNGSFTLNIADLSDTKGTTSFTKTLSDSSAKRSSAEWIEEAPSSGKGVLPLANFSTVTFSDAQTTIGTTTGAINNPA